MYSLTIENIFESFMCTCGIGSGWEAKRLKKKQKGNDKVCLHKRRNFVCSCGCWREKGNVERKWFSLPLPATRFCLFMVFELWTSSQFNNTQLREDFFLIFQDFIKQENSLIARAFVKVLTKKRDDQKRFWDFNF